VKRSVGHLIFEINTIGVVMTKKFITAIFAICIFFIFSGFDTKPQNPSEFGHFENGRYINTLFGLTIEFPENWSVLNKRQIEALRKVSKLAAGDNKKLQKQYEMQMKRTSMLVTAFMYPIPKTDGYNPSFGSTAENLNFYPGIKDGKDFLELLKRSQHRGQVKAKYPDEIQQTDINGTKFYMLCIESTFGTYHVKQKYFVTSMKGYLLTFLATYETQKDYVKIDKIFKSIKLQN